MQLKAWTLVIFIGLLTAIGFSSHVKPAQGYEEPIHDKIHFTGTDFASGSGTGFAVSTNGLTIADNELTAVYTSPDIEASLPFNVVVPQWDATQPKGTSITIQVRTRTSNGPWSDWFVMQEDHDLTVAGSNLISGNMISVPEIDKRHSHVQFSVSMGRNISLAAPVLEEMVFTFIDATSGPTTAELVAQQQALDANQNNTSYLTTGHPRPTIISREVWCFYDDCDYTDGLEYSPATHMVIHHTVSANGGTNWAATVRAIWSYHTYTNEWGDIGYNYLIDVDGLIYEGHLNEDYENLDVAGTHASGANLGSMGVSLLGTFTAVDHALPGIKPPEPMVDSLVNLLSWKADQRDIDVYDASNTLPNVGWGLPHLMGHRDAYGTTECPGDQAHALLPEIRDRIAANIGLTNEYLIVDEAGPYFTRSNTSWYEGPNECGTNGHSFYAWSTTNPDSPIRWGKWQPPITEAGYYRIEVRAPYCYTGRGETDGATYTINHANGTDTVILSHNDQLGVWMDLGVYYLHADDSTTVRLTNLTTTDEGKGVWFDDMRLIEVSPELKASSPTEEGWTNNPDVEFVWQLSNSSPPQTTTLKVATDTDLTNLVLEETIPGNVVSYTHMFTENVTLYWQTSVVLTGTQDSLVTSVSKFGVDTAVPTSTAQLIYTKNVTDVYNLVWTGTDELSGIAGYNVAYRTISETTWTSWLTTTVNTSATFTPPDPEQTYEFHIIATDHAGNIEIKTEPDLSTAEAIDLPHAIMLPMIKK